MKPVVCFKDSIKESFYKKNFSIKRTFYKKRRYLCNLLLIIIKIGLLVHPEFGVIA